MDFEHTVKNFSENGFAIIEDFISQEQVQRLKGRVDEIIDEMDPSQHPTATLRLLGNQPAATRQRDEYLMSSVDKICFFYEKDAIDDQGKLLMPRNKALNKIGHGLHRKDENFKHISFSPHMQSLLKALEFNQPAIIQSMYIFKPAHIGCEVAAHHDRMVLRLEPSSKLVGVWIAVEDATEENGCLEFVPGSHKIPNGYYHFARTHGKEEQLLRFCGEKPTIDQSKFVHAPVKKGSCVLIDGSVWHRSSRNISSNSRNAYICHVIERKDTVWHQDNWLQETESYKFAMVYDQK